MSIQLLSVPVISNFRIVGSCYFQFSYCRFLLFPIFGHTFMMTDRKDAGAEVGLKSSDLIGPRSFYHNRKDAGENGFREIKWAEHRWNTRIGIFFNTV